MERDESTFLQSLNSKKDKAFQDLFRMFYRSLVRFSEHYLKIREDAEDVVQKVFIALWEEDVYFTTLNSLRNFLYNSVKNASLNHLKHKDVEERYLSSFVWEDMVESDLDEKIMIEELYRLLFPDFVIVSPQNFHQRVLQFSGALPSALSACKRPCSEVA